MDSENVCQAIAPVQVTVDKAALLADAKPLTNSLSSVTKGSGATPEMVAPSCSVADVTNRVNDRATSWRQKDANNY